MDGDFITGCDNRIAGRDYYELGHVQHLSIEMSEFDREWGEPPAGSGLVLCPRCRRWHFAAEAIDCRRCGYPHREMLAEADRKADEDRRKAFALAMTAMRLRFLCGLIPFVCGDFYALMHLADSPGPSFAIPIGLGAGFVAGLLMWRPCRSLAPAVLRLFSR